MCLSFPYSFLDVQVNPLMEEISRLGSPFDRRGGIVVVITISTHRVFIRVFTAVFVAVFLGRVGSLLEIFEQLKKMNLQEIDKLHIFSYLFLIRKELNI